MSRPLKGVLGGALLGVLLAVPLVFVLSGGDGDADSPFRVDESAAERFVEAWVRSQERTYSVSATFTRTTKDGQVVQAATRTVQRPPERLVVGLGSVSGRTADERFACAADDSGLLSCRREAARLDHAEEVARDRERLELLVTETDDHIALYAVRVEPDGCFTLTLRADVAAPPYGVRSTQCFDDETGAPSRIEIRRAEAVDLTVADTISATVTDADLVPPERVEPVTG